MSSNASVNAAERYADYWVFGGIYRPVYLKIMPPEHIERMAIDARADGFIRAEIRTADLQNADNIRAVITAPGSGGKSFILSGPVVNKR